MKARLKEIGINESKNLGLKVEEARTLKGISRKDLADKLNFSEPTISMMGLGYSPPSDKTILLIAEATGMPYDWFFK